MEYADYLSYVDNPDLNFQFKHQLDYLTLSIILGETNFWQSKIVMDFSNNTEV